MPYRYFIMLVFILFSSVCLSGEEMCDACKNNETPSPIEKLTKLSPSLLSDLLFSEIPSGFTMMFSKDIEINEPHNHVEGFGIETSKIKSSGDFYYTPLIYYTRDEKDGDINCVIISKNVQKISAGDSFTVKKSFSHSHNFSNKPYRYSKGTIILKDSENSFLALSCWQQTSKRFPTDFWKSYPQEVVPKVNDIINATKSLISIEAPSGVIINP